MESRIYNVNLQSGFNTLTYIGISQYDAGVPLQFNVYDGATAASFPAGTTATIMGVRPSGVGFSTACTLTDNVVTVDTVTDMTGEAGKFPVEIRFTASGVDVGTVNFVFLIEKAPHPEGTIDADITHEQEFIDRLEAIEEWIATADQGVSDALKAALLQIAQKVVYIDEHGQDYYDALYDALYPPAPPATLVSISAVYTQSGTVYDTDTLDSLKTDLVVTAHYDDSTSAVVTTYTLSGTLTAGTSTITVSYSGKTTTFTVTVTAVPVNPFDGVHWNDGLRLSGNSEYSGQANYTTTDFVSVSDITDVTAELTSKSGNVQYTIAWYTSNSNSNYISHDTGYINYQSTQYSASVTSNRPSSAQYCRICTTKASTGSVSDYPYVLGILDIDVTFA